MNYGFGGKYSLGGVLTAPKKTTYVFPGLHEDELVVSQFMKLNLAMQWKPLGKLFIIPHVDLASVGFGEFSDYLSEAFSPRGKWSEYAETSALMAIGTTLAYHSFLGPVTFDLSWVNDVNKVRVFFGVGLQLNRSN